jgi:hypothetical protein
MAIVKQLRVSLKNQPGALAQLCSELAKRAVNIHAIHASTAPATGIVRLLPDKIDVARQVCADLDLFCSEEEVLAVKVGDRPGALGKVTRKLAEKGVNIDYLYGSIDRGSKRALIVLGVSDVAAAARVAR